MNITTNMMKKKVPIESVSHIGFCGSHTCISTPSLFADEELLIAVEDFFQEHRILEVCTSLVWGCYGTMNLIMSLLHRCQDPIEFLHEYEGREEEMFEYFQTKCVTAYNASPVTRLNIPGWTTTEQHLFLNGVMVFV